MRAILLRHAHRYPAWGVADVYKLLHQAAMGSEHAISDKNRARERLQKELAGLGPGPDEPLIDPISPDGKIVRIHLRPFYRLNLNQENLLSAFIQTGQVFPPSSEKMREYVTAATELAEVGQLGKNVEDINTFINSMADSGFPAVHHSNAFEETYSPAYRILAHELVPKDILPAV